MARGCTRDVSSVLVTIVVGPTEPFADALRRFTKLVERNGITAEARQRGEYMSRAERRRRKIRRALRRWRASEGRR